jgi:hypothetical protein
MQFLPVSANIPYLAGGMTFQPDNILFLEKRTGAKKNETCGPKIYLKAPSVFSHCFY